MRVRGAGGVIWEMDVPESGPARERFDGAVSKGELVVLDTEPSTEAEPSKDELVAEAEALGIHVDSRWGVKRLTDEIAAARQE